MHSLFLIPLRILTFYLGLTTSLFTLSAMGLPAASFYGRLLLSYLALMLCSIFGLITSIMLRPFGRHRNTQYLTARAFHHSMRLATGITFEIESGREHLIPPASSAWQRPPKPRVIVTNHQSELDVLLCGVAFPPYVSITAKSSLRWVPVLGWYMALSGTIFIDRGNRADALKAFRDAADEMRRQRQNVLIFPEGTRSYADRPLLGAFKKGAFHLAVQAGVDIVPVVAANYAGILNVKERIFRPGKIPVVVLPPIATSSLTAADVDDLTRSTRDSMLAALIALSASPSGQAAAWAPATPAEHGRERAAVLTGGSGSGSGSEPRVASGTEPRVAVGGARER